MVIESLLKHSNKLIIVGCTKHNIDLPVVRSKERIRNHIKRQLDIGIIDINRVVAALVEVEGWGRQQIYLYNWTGGETLKRQWKDRTWVESHISNMGLGHVFNRHRPISTVSESSLFTISYPQNSQRIRFIWVQNRSKLKRIEDEDPLPPEFEISPDGSQWQRKILHAYSEMVVRDITVFEWDIVSCQAMIMIRKLKGTKYLDVRNQITSELANIVPVLDFEPLRMSRLIDNLDSIDGVIRPKLRYRTLSDPDTIVTFTRRGRQDVLSNPTVRGLRQESREDVNGYGGFSLWPVDTENYVGIDLYALRETDHRIGIRGEQHERDVRALLQRIRPYCE